LRDYFANGQTLINLPLDLRGTDFQRRVWQALLQIPPGQTRSYGQLAQQLGSSARAVGNACRANPCPIVVPCHRVLARNGLGGYAGETQEGEQLQIKRWLLRHEGVVLD
jgi:methylated-DNA-[protein]-cysteine S-methyltransferase